MEKVLRFIILFVLATFAVILLVGFIGSAIFVLF